MLQHPQNGQVWKKVYHDGMVSYYIVLEAHNSGYKLVLANKIMLKDNEIVGQGTYKFIWEALDMDLSDSSPITLVRDDNELKLVKMLSV